MDVVKGRFRVRKIRHNTPSGTKYVMGRNEGTPSVITVKALGSASKYLEWDLEYVKKKGVYVNRVTSRPVRIKRRTYTSVLELPDDPKIAADAAPALRGASFLSLLRFYPDTALLKLSADQCDRVDAVHEQEYFQMWPALRRRFPDLPDNGPLFASQLPVGLKPDKSIEAAKDLYVSLDDAYVKVGAVAIPTLSHPGALRLKEWNVLTEDNALASVRDDITYLRKRFTRIIDTAHINATSVPGTDGKVCVTTGSSYVPGVVEYTGQRADFVIHAERFSVDELMAINSDAILVGDSWQPVSRGAFFAALSTGRQDWPAMMGDGPCWQLGVSTELMTLPPQRHYLDASSHLTDWNLLGKMAKKKHLLLKGSPNIPRGHDIHTYWGPQGDVVLLVDQDTPRKYIAACLKFAANSFRVVFTPESTIRTIGELPAEPKFLRF